MIIWVANIDSDRTRLMGRKLAKGLSVKEPSLKELSKAAHNLGLQCTRENDKKYPRDRAMKQDSSIDGRVVISKMHPKTKTLKLLADEIRRIRSQKDQG